MLLEKTEALLDYELIYKPDNNQKLLYEIKKENNAFEMIYKSNENIDEKKKKLKRFKEYNLFHFVYNKEYSGDVIRIFDKYFINHNKNKCKLI